MSADEPWARHVDYRRFENCTCNKIIRTAIYLQLGDPLEVYAWYCPTCDPQSNVEKSS